MSNVKKEVIGIAKGVAETAATAVVNDATTKVTKKLETEAAKSKSDWVPTRNAVESVVVTGLASYLLNMLKRFLAKL